MKNNKKTCFVMFSGNCSEFSLKLAKKINPFLDFFILSYQDNGEEQIARYKDYTHVVFNRDSLRKRFSTAYPKFHEDNWTIMPGNLDLAQLAFCEVHSHYDFFWFCEDDVRFTGKWDKLFDISKDSSVDLIATNFRELMADWPHRASFKGKGLVQPKQLAFLPLFRISQRAAEAIVNAYEQGWTGHHEVTWPTILEANTLTMADLNDVFPGSYTSNPNSMGMGPGTFIYSPPKLFAGFKSDTFYHPVKDFSTFYDRTVKEFYKLKVKKFYYKQKFIFFETVKKIIGRR